jgi:hypothetical protein
MLLDEGPIDYTLGAKLRQLICPFFSSKDIDFNVYNGIYTTAMSSGAKFHDIKFGGNIFSLIGTTEWYNKII